jgi:starch-binding outer membrane protein, SusD/RagB family
MNILKNIKKSFGKLPFWGLGGFLVLATSCSTDQSYVNPSSASEPQVVNDVNGLIALCNGLQFRFTVGRASPGYAYATTSGLVTRELAVLNAGNADEDALRQGANNVTFANSLPRNVWTACNLTKATADLILKNANIATDAGTKSGIVAYAAIYRALALGTMAQFWQQVTIKSEESALFSSREDALKEAISTLENAATVLATAPSSAFTSRIVPGLDLANTVQALIARYANILGDNDKALAATAKIDLTKRSFWSFDDTSRNPLFESLFSNKNVAEPNPNFGLTAPFVVAVTDKRTGFYYTTGSATVNTGFASFYKANTTPVPVYLPGEMLLIRAEALARKGDLTNAVVELNKVLTKTTDAWGIGAALPTYSGSSTAEAILTEIYRNRCIELFMSGMKLEDSRRFGRPAAGTTGAERSRNWMPYPNTERQNNPNTPADPAI